MITEKASQCHCKKTRGYNKSCKIENIDNIKPIQIKQDIKWQQED